MSPFSGFPRGARYTPVPNLFFGELLEQLDNLAELKCVLRVLALAYARKGFPQGVPEEEVLGDRVLLKALGGAGAIREALSKALKRGVLLRGAIDGKVVVALHTDAHREALGPVDGVGSVAGDDQIPVEEPNIFALYEQNIGMLTPIIAEELKDAEQTYPPEWVRDALREAVSRNKRSWRYVESILKRWAIEGRDNGEPGRHPQKITATEYIHRYGLPR